MTIPVIASSTCRFASFARACARMASASRVPEQWKQSKRRSIAATSKPAITPSGLLSSNWAAIGTLTTSDCQEDEEAPGCDQVADGLSLRHVALEI